MKRLPAAAFAALVVATVAAFFIAQHLKVTTPFLQGGPAPKPGAINPVDGYRGLAATEPKVCWIAGNQSPTARTEPVNYRHTFTTFYLQHQAGHVAVYVVDTEGNIVRTIAADYDFPRTYRRNPASAFVWNGRENDGTLAPDGTYYYRVVLVGKGRTVQINRPITVITRPPRPRVLSATALSAAGKPVAGRAVIAPVTPAAATGATGTTGTTGTSAPAAAPSRVQIRYDSGRAAHGQIVLFRAAANGTLTRVFAFGANPRAHVKVWNGLIHGTPAPAGTYLIGYQSIDQACNVGITPADGFATAGDVGVTVRYLTAQVPNTPVAAGADADVTVDASGHEYFWALHRAGGGAAIERGSASATDLKVHLPASAPGLYELAIRSSGHRTVVPLASAAANAKPRSVLVVLPVLTWQGLNPVDDDGDGVVNTLADGASVSLDRPLVQPPAGFADVSALLGEFDAAHFHYQLTTDLALAENPAGVLAGHRGVVFAGNETWLPASLRTALRAWVEKGGHVLALGTDTLRRTVTLTGTTLSHPTAAATTDLFGARRGAIVAGNHLPLLPYGSGSLGLFSTSSQDFTGVASYQPIIPPAGSSAGTVGISAQQSAIAGFHVGQGAVVEVGLGDFGARVAHQLQWRAVLARIWRLLGS